MSHASRLYLDHPYERDNKEPGLYWATDSIDTRDVFNYHLPPLSNSGGISPQVVDRLCDMYNEQNCPSLYLPENVVGKSLVNQLGLVSPNFYRCLKCGHFDEVLVNRVSPTSGISHYILI